MSEVDHLIEELQEANKALNPCVCGSPVKIDYHPGVSYVHCRKCGVVAQLPDWSVTPLAEGWNAGEIKPPTALEKLKAKAACHGQPF